VLKFGHVSDRLDIIYALVRSITSAELSQPEVCVKSESREPVYRWSLRRYNQKQVFIPDPRVRLADFRVEARIPNQEPLLQQLCASHPGRTSQRSRPSSPVTRPGRGTSQTPPIQSRHHHHHFPWRKTKTGSQRLKGPQIEESGGVRMLIAVTVIWCGFLLRLERLDVSRIFASNFLRFLREWEDLDRHHRPTAQMHRLVDQQISRLPGQSPLRKLTHGRALPEVSRRVSPLFHGRNRPQPVRRRSH